MADERIKLEVKERETLGSAETRRLRKQGLIPGVAYGRGKQPTAVCVAERELRRVLTGSHGLHAILDVEFTGSGSARPSILKDYQQDAFRGHVMHVDLQEVRLDQPIQASVTVELIGGEEAPGVKEGGVLSQVSREINVEALPLEVPQHIDVDVSALHIGDSIRLSDIETPAGVTFLDDPEETVLASVTQPTRVEEPEEMLEEGEEPATAPEGGEPESATDAPGEPDAAAAGGEGTVAG